MSVLVALWVGTLGVIYASSYFEMSKQNQEMLRTHAEMYSLSQYGETVPPEKPQPDDNKGFKRDFDPQSPKFQLSTFYTVAVSYSGEILEIKNEQSAVHSAVHTH